MGTSCKTCIHKKVCDLWRKEECQSARSFFDDECELYAEVPHWIPVTERLPEVGEDVLIYAVGKSDDFSSVIAITNRMIFRLFPSCDGVETWKSPWQYFMTNYEITHWTPLPEPPKEETVNEITTEMIEAAERNEKRIKEKVDRIYDELIAEKRAEIERLKAEIAQMPPLDYDKLAENPPEYPVCVGYKCWDGKEDDNDNKNL